MNKLTVQLLAIKGNWREVADMARNTVGMDPGEGEPSSFWKRRMLMCEHSPIRTIFIKWKFQNLMQWVHVHFIRHKFGIEHWVSSQREDRTGIPRNERSQCDELDLISESNLQEIIFISRKRLCRQASRETREAWQMFLESIKDVQPELYQACVPECVYRNGLCPEFKTCGWNQTPGFEKWLKQYIYGFEDRVNKKTLI